MTRVRRLMLEAQRRAANARYASTDAGKTAKAAADKKYQQKIRRQCLVHYSQSDPPCCVCPGCTENRIEFLTIDHIEGGGRKHRKEIGNGSNTYKWLKRKGFPKGFRTLCYNCNNSYAHYGRCPHCDENTRPKCKACHQPLAPKKAKVRKVSRKV